MHRTCSAMVMPAGLAARGLLIVAAAVAMLGGCSPAATACGGSGQACCSTGAGCNSTELSCESGTCRPAGGACAWTTPGTECVECLAAEAPDGCAASLRICERNAMCNASLGTLESCLCGAGTDAASASACLGTFETAAGSALGGPELANCSTSSCAGPCGR